MRLNADYVRDILLYVEKNLNYKLPYVHKEISYGNLLRAEHFINHDKSELTYALELLIKNGFIDLAANPVVTDGNINHARIIGLTWNGHELLDNIRDDTVWNTVKKKATRYSGLSISALFRGAKALGSALMTDPNAIQNFLDGVNNIENMF